MTPEDRAAARQHFERGRTAYDAGQHESAIKELKQAYMISRKAGILFNLGQTYLKVGDTGLALHFFGKFMAEAEADDPNRPVADAAIRDLQAKAASETETASPESKERPNPPDGVPPRPPPIPAAEGLDHVPVDEARPGHPIDVEIRLDVEASSHPSHLLFRAPGQQDYTRVAFLIAQAAAGADEDDSGRRRLVARIPGAVTASGAKAVQYYVEIRSPDGRVYATSGTAATPHLVVIDAAAASSAPSERPGGSAGTPSGWSRMVRVGKWSSAGAALILAGVSMVYAAQSARLSAEIEQRARSSSAKDPGEGRWGPPQLTYDASDHRVSRDGHRANTVAWVSAAAALVLGAAGGALFVLDHLRQPDVTFAANLGPAFGGASGILRF